MDLSEIKRQGARKYFDDKGAYRNQYPLGSAEYNEFERGWMQSLKKDEGRLVSTSATPCSPSRKTSDAPTYSEIQAERYRSRKG